MYAKKYSYIRDNRFDCVNFIKIITWYFRRQFLTKILILLLFRKIVWIFNCFNTSMIKLNVFSNIFFTFSSIFDVFIMIWRTLSFDDFVFAIRNFQSTFLYDDFRVTRRFCLMNKLLFDKFDFEILILFDVFWSMNLTLFDNLFRKILLLFDVLVFEFVVIQHVWWTLSKTNNKTHYVVKNVEYLNLLNICWRQNRNSNFVKFQFENFNVIRRCLLMNFSLFDVNRSCIIRYSSENSTLFDVFCR